MHDVTKNLYIDRVLYSPTMGSSENLKVSGNNRGNRMYIYEINLWGYTTIMHKINGSSRENKLVGQVFDAREFDQTIVWCHAVDVLHNDSKERCTVKKSRIKSSKAKSFTYYYILYYKSTNHNRKMKPYNLIIKRIIIYVHNSSGKCPRSFYFEVLEIVFFVCVCVC
jgi:hypothetical protein